MSTNSEWTDALWQNPSSEFRSAPFWAWNDLMTPDHLTRQIEQMNQAGMGGFFMHSRYGLKTEYLSDEWFEAVSACIEKARQLEMKAYLYDEDRWPSGAAGGLITRPHPEHGIWRLAVVCEGDVPAEFERVGVFAVKFDSANAVESYRLIEEGATLSAGERQVLFVATQGENSGWYNEGTYLDVLSAEAVAEFIRVTYQAYADRYGRDFGALVPAIFTDEPNYGHCTPKVKNACLHTPWTPELPRHFRKRRGYDLREKLPEIALPLSGGGFSKVRHDYYRTVTELFVENFSQQIGQWCGRHNIAFTGHYLQEQTFATEISEIGAALPHYEHQQWPGIDILCDQRSEVFTAKGASSVASQMGHARVLSELYGCTGWDWPLEGHKFNAGWQFVLGVNFRCPHLSWYSMAGGAKRDYPASIFPHSPWWKYYKAVEDYFGRLSLMLTQGRPVRDVLLLSSIESAWGVYLRQDHAPADRLWQPFNELMTLLLDEHYDFDLGDESLLAKHGKVSQGNLSLNKMKYSLVIVPPCTTLRSGTVAMLRRLVENGGTVLFVGELPRMVDGVPSDEIAALTEQAMMCANERGVIVATLEDALPRRVSVVENGRQAADVWTMLRHIKGANKQAGQLLFVQSLDRRGSRQVHVSLQGRRPAVLWDCQSGTRTRLEARSEGDRVEFDLELPPTGSALVSLGLSVRDALPPAKPEKVVESIALPGPWAAEVLEENVLPLDYTQVRIGEGSFSEPLPVMAAEDRIREHFGLPRRRNGGCQPWYLAKTGRADRGVRGRAELRFTFHVTTLPAKLELAIERPEDFEIVLNGQSVSSRPAGWWVDEGIARVDVRPAAREGENELLLRFDYRSDMEIEDLHLIGPFGVGQKDAQRVPGAFTLAKLPDRLPAGSWQNRGLDFYGGAVKYRMKLGEAVWTAIKAGRRVVVALNEVKCTAAALHVGEQTFVLPWAPMRADITEALLRQNQSGCDEIAIEVVGGRHNSFGPLHVAWGAWTGPGEFEPENKNWKREYILNDMGLMAEPVIEVIEW